MALSLAAAALIGGGIQVASTVASGIMNKSARERIGEKNKEIDKRKQAIKKSQDEFVLSQQRRGVERERKGLAIDTLRKESDMKDAQKDVKQSAFDTMTAIQGNRRGSLLQRQQKNIARQMGGAGEL